MATGPDSYYEGVLRLVYFPESLDDKLHKIASHEGKNTNQVARELLEAQIETYTPKKESARKTQESTIVMRSIYLPITLDYKVFRLACQEERTKSDVIVDLVRAETKKYDAEGRCKQ